MHVYCYASSHWSVPFSGLDAQMGHVYKVVHCPFQCFSDTACQRWTTVQKISPSRKRKATVTAVHITSKLTTEGGELSSQNSLSSVGLRWSVPQEELTLRFDTHCCGPRLLVTVKSGSIIPVDFEVKSDVFWTWRARVVWRTILEMWGKFLLSSSESLKLCCLQLEGT